MASNQIKPSLWPKREGKVYKFLTHGACDGHIPTDMGDVNGGHFVCLWHTPVYVMRDTDDPELQFHLSSDRHEIMCTGCGERWVGVTIEELRAHRMVCPKVTIYVCRFCGQLFKLLDGERIAAYPEGVRLVPHPLYDGECPQDVKRDREDEEMQMDIEQAPTKKMRTE